MPQASRSLSVVRPADAGAVIADLLAILGERVRRDPELQRELLRALSPIVRVVPERRRFE